MQLQWGDVPAWAAIAISVIAGVHSWWAGRKAAQASAGAASLEVSLERIADALQKPVPAAEAKAAGTRAVKPQFVIEYIQGHSYRLRNTSTVPATGVRVDLGPFPAALARRVPDGVDLPPFAGTEPFVVVGSWQTPPPSSVLVSSNETSQAAHVPLPPRR